MSKQCINYYCKSKRNEELYAAQQSVCNYYNVRYKPYRRVCRVCMKKSTLFLNKISTLLKNQKFIFDDDSYSRKNINIIELSDSDDSITDNNDGPSTSYLNPQTTKLPETIHAVWNKTVKPLVTVQKEKITNYLISERSQLIAGIEQIKDTVTELDNKLKNMYDKIYKFDKQQEFEFDKEINIVDTNDVCIVSSKMLPGLPKDLPKGGRVIRPLLKMGDQVYGMKDSQLQPWVKATIKSAVSDTYFNIIFDDGKEIILNNKNLAYINTLNEAQYPVGSRVIAKFQDMNIQLTDKFYVGVVAEPPKYLNKFRYMVFFDDGYTQYVNHKDIRLVCGEPTNISDDVHENIREFVKIYLQKYPERLMVKFNKKQVVRAELDNRWVLAKVTNLDASLVQLKFLYVTNERTEWMYRGSNRLSPIYNRINSNNQDKHIRSTMGDVIKFINQPYIELENLTENEESISNVDSDIQKDNDLAFPFYSTRKKHKPQENNGIIKIIKIPSNCPKPLSYKHHQCSLSCMLRVRYDYSKTRDINVLSIPLHFGFTRLIKTDKDSKLKKVIYTTPCGREINDKQTMYKYLKETGYGNNTMTIDLFDFDYMINPLSSFSVPEKYIRVHDISYEMEFKTISVANSLNDLVPKHITYITKRKPTPGVNLNLDPKFLCGCDCTDNCQDKTKCSCWQLTYESKKNYPNIIKGTNIGYNYKRLESPLYTGIFECNINCKCTKTCLNRVVQEPLKTSLQLFLTENKGWGVRTLTDIPKGTFVCTFVGEVRTENDEAINGDEYSADLDFLKTVEEFKEGYESYVAEEESENCTSTSDEEFNPSSEIKSKMNVNKSKMSLRTNLQNTNTKIDGKHQLSKLNTQKKVESKHKSIIELLDKDCGVHILDSKVSGNIGRYFNHSCDPNIFIQNVFVDTHDLRFPWIAYFALKNISAGTELAWNYNYIIGSVPDKKMKCYCKTKKCKIRLL
ncbi:histone-lysine N-methyltransferase SETDB1-like isoform X2 [Aphis gossypii]|nr:histone-lysine N-methyltransferase SETDB1-like isoform X2 [Aphis gossypii]XP_050056014.1 histone-lysine N-methyltransferase SETDB1-like isoform X2 [Aphis gossypii]